MTGAAQFWSTRAMDSKILSETSTSFRRLKRFSLPAQRSEGIGCSGLKNWGAVRLQRNCASRRFSVVTELQNERGAVVDFRQCPGRIIAVYLNVRRCGKNCLRIPGLSQTRSSCHNVHNPPRANRLTDFSALIKPRQGVSRSAGPNWLRQGAIQRCTAYVPWIAEWRSKY